MLMENKLYERSISTGEQALRIMQRCGMDTSGFYYDTMNRINFCKNKLDPSHPYTPPKKKEKERELVEVSNTACNFCGVKAKRAIDEPIIEGRGKIVFKRCGRCKAVHYCSPSCQKADWKGHSKTCVPATESPAKK